MAVSDRGIIRLIFPPRCVICREILDISKKIEVCDGCFKAIPFYEGTPPVYRSDGFDALVPLCRYEGVIRSSIINFKFYDKTAYFRAFAALLHDKLMDCKIAEDIDAVIAVPLHAARFRRRGYNQAALLSAALAQKLGKPEMSRLLKRKKDTLSQSTLRGSHRQENVAGAFAFLGDGEIRGKNILLVDDILTTGSTAGECSRVLKGAGAAKITTAVLATSRGRFKENT